MDPFTLSVLWAAVPTIAGGLAWLVGFSKDSVELYSAIKELRRSRQTRILLELAPPDKRQARQRIEQLYSSLELAEPAAREIMRRARRLSLVRALLVIASLSVVAVGIYSVTGVVPQAARTPGALLLGSAIAAAIGFAISQGSRNFRLRSLRKTVDSLAQELRGALSHAYTEGTRLAEAQLRAFSASSTLRLSRLERDFLGQYITTSDLVRRLEAYLLHIQLKISKGNLRIHYVEKIRELVSDFVVRVLADPQFRTLPNSSSRAEFLRNELRAQGLSDFLPSTKSDFESLLAEESVASYIDHGWGDISEALLTWTPLQLITE